MRKAIEEFLRQAVVVRDGRVGETAERVELVLPETGVCSGGGLVDEPGTEGQASSGGCCGPIEPIALAAPAIARR